MEKACVENGILFNKYAADQLREY